jgi:hypothetical protein
MKDLNYLRPFPVRDMNPEFGIELRNAKHAIATLGPPHAISIALAI